MQQRTDEWLMLRAGKFTASNFHKLMGKTLTQTAQTYILEKVTELIYGLQDSFDNEAMRWGTDYEPEAKEYYELTTGDKVQELAFIKHSEHIGGSPDGLIGDNGAIEIKCPFNPVNHIRYKLCKNAEDLKKLNKANYWQCIGVLWLSGREWIDFVSYDPRLQGVGRMSVLRIARNEQAIKELKAALHRAVVRKEEI